jgi:hypothetical protein
VHVALLYAILGTTRTRNADITPQYQVLKNVEVCLLDLLYQTLMMEAVSSAETSATFYHIKGHEIPENTTICKI